MKLYLARHGEAVSENVDPQRPLSDGGRLDVERMGTFLRAADVFVPRVLHSGKLRARQTAEILAHAVADGIEPVETAGLSPLDPPGPLVAEFDNWTEDTMLVGHLPFMGRLVSRLVMGHDSVETIVFRAATVVRLERDAEAGWLLSWVIAPGLLPR